MRYTDWVQALGGLGVFLFSLRFLAGVLNRSISRRFRPRLGRLLVSPVRGVAVGAFTTFFAQASSITIIAAMGLLANGLVTFEQGFYVMLGATVGTTLKAWFFAENFQAVGPLVIGVTSLALIFLRHPLGREACEAALSIGFTFLGLDMLAKGLGPLAQEPAFMAALRHFDGTNLGSQALGMMTGCALAMAVQSSSTVVFLVLDLAGRGMISFPAGAALILGANVGTTLTPLLASLEYGRDVKRLALAHLVVKGGGAIIALLVFPVLAVIVLGLVERLPIQATGAVQLAALHTTFNVFNVAGWLLAGPLLIAALRWLVPGRQDEASVLPVVVRKLLVNAPDRALMEVEGQVTGLARLGKTLSDECLDLIVGGKPMGAVHARVEFDQLRDGAYELLGTLARSTQGQRVVATRVRDQLRLVGVCDQVGTLALELRTHLDRGLHVDGYELPAEVSLVAGELRTELDGLWLGVFFAGHMEALDASRAGGETFTRLEGACFDALAGAERRDTDMLLWLLEVVTRLRQLHDTLVMLRAVAGAVAPDRSQEVA